MADTAKLILDGQEIELPVLVGTEGEKAVDISSLRAETGYITYDPSFANTGSCQSEITYIDGENGILRYRGIPIQEFTKAPDFLEVAFLLIFGHLPNREERDRFGQEVRSNQHVNEAIRHHFQGFPNDAPPMAMLSAMINALSCFHPQYFVFDRDDADSQAHFEQAAARLISKVRTIAAYAYRTSQGLPIMYPDMSLKYAANFLHMMFSMPYHQHIVDPEIEDAMNLILILHADHEQNCSTSTVRVVGSSQANLFASLASGVCALWGPLHGGANVAVIDMLQRIHQGNMTPEDAIKLAKDKNSDFKLYGFGHRVYKNFDPRAEILSGVADRVLTKLGVNDPYLNTARKLAEIALKDPYFVDRKLYPNVDFYSGIILRAIGIPLNMFTVMFAIGRLPGWIAQWKELHDTPGGRICRPRQVYTGPTVQKYVPIDERP